MNLIALAVLAQDALPPPPVPPNAPWWAGYVGYALAVVVPTVLAWVGRRHVVRKRAGK